MTSARRGTLKCFRFLRILQTMIISVFKSKTHFLVIGDLTKVNKRTKKSRSSVAGLTAAVTVIAAFALTVLVFTQSRPVQAQNDKTVSNVAQPQVAPEAGNLFYRVHVQDVAPQVGRYTVTTGDSHPVDKDRNVLYGSPPGTPDTTFNSIRSYTTNTTYVQGPFPSGPGIVNLDNFNPTVASINDGTGIRVTWDLFNNGSPPDPLIIVQDITVVGTTFADSKIEVTVSVTNPTGPSRSIGIRYLWDYQIGSDDGPTFQEQDPEGPVRSQEAEFILPAFATYKIEDNDTNATPPTFNILGSASDGGTAPDKLQYASWPQSRLTAFDYTVTGLTVAGGVGNDSAVLYYFGRDSANALVIPVNTTRTVTAVLLRLEAAACEITCPPNVSKDADANQCSAVVNYPDPAVTSSCDGEGPPQQAVCNPPSGSRFPVGETTVNCSVNGGDPSCSFTVAVMDRTPPVFACPNQPVPTQCTGPLTYATPSATDNCTVTSVTCVPPSGSPFPAGSTVVTCVARDGSGNEGTCSFQVVAEDKIAPVINCPASPAPVTAASGSCTASVTFARATATDSCGGEVTVRGVRLDTNQEVGVSDAFPVGDTFIQWTATDKAGNQSFCSTQQKVTVIGQSNIVVPVEVDFGSIDFQIAKKKKAKKRFVSLADSARSFAIKNNGCSSVTLTLKSINRVGEDVTNGKITNTDDSAFFFIEEQGGGIKTPTSNSVIQIASLGEKKFNITFRPELPISSGGKNSGLSTKQALPDPFAAKMILTDANGTIFEITLKADLSNGVHFINPDDIQKKAPVVGFSKSGDVFTVEYTLYDADTGGKQANSASFVKSAKYEFLDNSGDVVETVDVDLAGPIEAANLAKGQRFKVTKTFSGANDNSSVSRVRVTVTDGAASPSLEANLGSTATQSFVSTQGFAFRGDVTIYLPGDRLEGFKR